MKTRPHDMEAPGLCLRLSMLLLVLPGSRVESSGEQRLTHGARSGLVLLLTSSDSLTDADFWAVTSRLQYFQYEAVSFHCQGLSGSSQLRGLRNAEGFLTLCDLQSPWSSFSCTVETAYPGDSGRYWCETETGQRSGAVNISVTAGSVILVSPVLPVTEGVSVTLRCRQKVSSSSTADFYKDGRLVARSSTGEMSVHSVSQSDEGLYKCSVPGAGESPQSRLLVRADAVVLLCPVLPVMEGVNVTLLCRKNSISPNSTAAFYKDGVFLRSSATGRTTLHSVSKADEGFYSCSLSGGGASAPGWLAVKAHHRDTCSSGFVHAFLVLRIVLTVLMSVLLLGLLCYGHSQRR
ncbi:sialoadhesin-like isoform X1 [Betta splendens]|uniref:Sialoadhesin-like isoform X1 n=1 Tax=Betta splendens TaxID=158456 RepID=A0A9W2Y6Z8_BETSP|nr:sialoadhesin-like isoform X1 [Betta splendens]